jgi:hypothetical protein
MVHDKFIFSKQARMIDLTPFTVQILDSRRRLHPLILVKSSDQDLNRNLNLNQQRRYVQTVHKDSLREILLVMRRETKIPSLVDKSFVSLLIVLFIPQSTPTPKAAEYSGQIQRLQYRNAYFESILNRYGDSR